MKKKKKKKVFLHSAFSLFFGFYDIFLIALSIYFVSFPRKVNARKVKDFILGEVEDLMP